jgi:signal transduction histidine kinase
MQVLSRVVGRAAWEYRQAMERPRMNVGAVTITAEGDRLHLAVTDDGCGGADATRPGLSGLADRVGALDGRLQVISPPGEGTRVQADLPCG